MKYYSIGEFANEIGKTIQTLRNWDKSGKLKPAYIAPGGHRYYTQSQLIDYRNNTNDRITIGYCRETEKTKSNLEMQKNHLRDYMDEKKYTYEIISDIGNTDFDRVGLKQLIDMITEHNVKRIVIMNKSKLSRFGFDIIKIICEKYDTEIEILNTDEDINDLIEDMTNIISEIYFENQKEKTIQKTKDMVENLFSQK